MADQNPDGVYAVGPKPADQRLLFKLLMGVVDRVPAAITASVAATIVTSINQQPDDLQSWGIRATGFFVGYCLYDLLKSKVNNHQKEDASENIPSRRPRHQGP